MKMTNAKTSLLAAYRAIGPDTINRLMTIGYLPAHTRSEHFAPYAARASFEVRSEKYSPNGDTYNLPNLPALEKYGQAAYVYSALHTHWREISQWTGKRDWITQSAKAAAMADVPASDLTDLELGCRAYTALVEEDSLPGEIVEEYVKRRTVAITDVARELGLAVQKTSSTSLHRQRKEGISGQAVHALWGAMRDRLNFRK